MDYYCCFYVNTENNKFSGIHYRHEFIDDILTMYIDGLVMNKIYSYTCVIYSSDITAKRAADAKTVENSELGK